MRKSIAAACAVVGMLVTAGTAAAQDEFTLFGGATIEDGHVTLVSNVADATVADFSGIDFDVPAGTTFAELTTLSTDFNVTNDDCLAGSPRFQINIGGSNVHVYLGPTPNFTGCPTGWIDSGNLIGSTDARFDLTQLGGPFYGTYADALALLGGQTVTGIQLVVDSGWAFADGEQTNLVDNVVINDTTFTFTRTPTAKDECKNGGWATFTELGFKNQGDCVSYVATGGRNTPAGA
jgi:hypothetical protein